jgi:hypothetical protein
MELLSAEQMQILGDIVMGTAFAGLAIQQTNQIFALSTIDGACGKGAPFPAKINAQKAMFPLHKEAWSVEQDHGNTL